jgi:hypothetical protein
MENTTMNSRALDLDIVAAGWTRLGVMLNVTPARHTPDLERLILDTARIASSNSRLFLLAASWLARYGDYVARHATAVERRFNSDRAIDEEREVNSVSQCLTAICHICFIQPLPTINRLSVFFAWPT